MANHVLRLVDTGVSGTVNLTDWADYSPQSPQIDALDYEPAGWQSGGERLLVTRRNVDETCRVWFDYATTAAIRGTINYIEKMFSRAEHHQATGMAYPVYVEFDPGTSGTAYRSEILSGRVELDPDALKNPQWDNTRIGATLHWRRRWYWEGPETQLTLANNHGTATSAVVYNHNYVGGGTVRHNWVALTDGTAYAGGVLPSPVKLRLTNNSGTSINKVWMAHNAWCSMINTGHILEAETLTSHGGTATVDAGSSGGQYVNMSPGTAFYTTTYWALTPTHVDLFRGNWISALLRCRVAPNPNTFTAYLRLTVGGLFTVWQNVPMVLPQLSTIPMGTFRLPPGLPNKSDYQDMRLYLYIISNNALATFQPDFMALLPSDGFREHAPTTGSFYTASRTVDDMIAGEIYNESTGGTALTAHITPLGGDIELWPDREQRLYFLCSGMATHGTIGVEAWYRPRRYTL